MEVEKVDIKELWFTEQLLYWNDIKDNRIKELEEKNKKLENKIRRLKITRGIISDCIMFAFFCFMCAWVLCIFFMMIVDVIMWFQFVRFA